MQLHEDQALPYVLSVPPGPVPVRESWPLLCFLHGYDEGAPLAIEEAMARHGPLSDTAAAVAREQFIVVAPQLPSRGDLWHEYADVVERIVLDVREAHHGDVQRMYLTGFSYGGNGVLDLAVEQRNMWAALWPVDPTRLAREDPGRPVWLSVGSVARSRLNKFEQGLGVAPANGASSERRYLDEGEDHVGSAHRAYGDPRVYAWLLSQALVPEHR